MSLVLIINPRYFVLVILNLHFLILTCKPVVQSFLGLA
jgi:hypothetical protein